MSDKSVCMPVSRRACLSAVISACRFTDLSAGRLVRLSADWSSDWSCGRLSDCRGDRFFNQSHCKETRIFWNLYHFSGKWQHVAPVGTDCPGQSSVRYRVKGVTLHPNGRVRRRWRSPEFERHSPNPSPTDFYVHLNIARYVFSRSKYFEQPRKRLALAGGGLTLRSREASQTCGAVPRSGGLCRQTAKSKVI